MAVRRECRGLLVDKASGRIIARRFHKFFNINERPETMSTEVQRLVTLQSSTGTSGCGECIITEKIDGSLVSPVFVSSPEGALIWATKSMEMQDIGAFVAEQFADKGYLYEQFARHWYGRGYSSLFEWCQQGRAVGVINHQASSLILLALRHTTTGKYISHPEMELAAEGFVPVSRRVASPRSSLETVQSVLEEVDGWEGREGVVLRLRDGQMYKAKCSWYVAMAEAFRSGNSGTGAFLLALLKNRPTLLDVPTESIWGSILRADGHNDDVLAACCTVLDRAGASSHSKQLMQFFEQVQTAIALLATELLEWGRAIRQDEKKAGSDQNFNVKRMREAAIAVGVETGWSPQLLSASLKGDAAQLALELNSSLRRFDALSGLLGLAWDVNALTSLMIETKEHARNILHAVDAKSANHDNEPHISTIEAGLDLICLDGAQEEKSQEKIQHSRPTPAANDDGNLHGEMQPQGVKWLSPLPLRIPALSKGDVQAYEYITSLVCESADILHGPAAVPALVVLRGLPGIGKSHLARLLSARLGSSSSRICSADAFFQAGAGVLSAREMKAMSPEEIYNKAFDVQKLASAHAFCRENVQEALESGIPLVIVDNTNSQLREYAAYLKAARAHNYTPVVVELVPGSREAALNLSARNKHSVPTAAIARMLSRWQPDTAAIKICPHRMCSFDSNVDQTQHPGDGVERKAEAATSAHPIENPVPTEFLENQQLVDTDEPVESQDGNENFYRNAGAKQDRRGKAKKGGRGKQWDRTSGSTRNAWN